MIYSYSRYLNRFKTEVLYLNSIFTCKFIKMELKKYYKIELKSKKPDSNPNACVRETMRMACTCVVTCQLHEVTGKTKTEVQ